MARISGVSRDQAGIFVRLAYWLTRRKVGKVITPVTLYAHHPRLLRAHAHMEMGQEQSCSVSAVLKILVQVKVAMMIGCPF